VIAWHDGKCKTLLQEVALLATFLRQLEAAGGVPPGALQQHVPGLVLEAHHLAAL